LGRQTLGWQGWVASGRGRQAQRWGCTMVVRFPKLRRHWSCLCWRPRPHVTLQSDQTPCSQLHTPRHTHTHTHMYTHTHTRTHTHTHTHVHTHVHCARDSKLNVEPIYCAEYRILATS